MIHRAQDIVSSASSRHPLKLLVAFERAYILCHDTSIKGPPALAVNHRYNQERDVMAAAPGVAGGEIRRGEKTAGTLPVQFISCTV